MNVWTCRQGHCHVLGALGKKYRFESHHFDHILQMQYVHQARVLGWICFNIVRQKSRHKSNTGKYCIGWNPIGYAVAPFGSLQYTV